MKRRLTISYKPQSPIVIRRSGRNAKPKGWRPLIGMTALLVIVSAAIIALDSIHVRLALADSLQAQVSTIEARDSQLKLQNDQIASENAKLKAYFTSPREDKVPQSVVDLSQFYIRKYFPPQIVNQALAVSKCESRGWDYRVVHTNSDGSRDWGLFQINDNPKNPWVKLFENTYHIPFETGALDPNLNAQFAYKYIYAPNGNWHDWSCVTLGIVKP